MSASTAPLLDISRAYRRGHDDGMVAILSLLLAACWLDDEVREWVLDQIARIEEMRE